MELVNLVGKSQNSSLRSMITKSSKNSGGLEACCHIRTLVRYIKVPYFCHIILKQKYIAGLDITMNDTRLCFLMQVFKSFCSPHSNLNSFCPRQNYVWLCPFSTLLPWGLIDLHYNGWELKRKMLARKKLNRLHAHYIKNALLMIQWVWYWGTLFSLKIPAEEGSLWW